VHEHGVVVDAVTNIGAIFLLPQNLFQDGRSS